MPANFCSGNRCVPAPRAHSHEPPLQQHLSPLPAGACCCCSCSSPSGSASAAAALTPDVSSHAYVPLDARSPTPPNRVYQPAQGCDDLYEIFGLSGRLSGARHARPRMCLKTSIVDGQSCACCMSCLLQRLAAGRLASKAAEWQDRSERSAAGAGAPAAQTSKLITSASRGPPA